MVSETSILRKQRRTYVSQTEARFIYEERRRYALRRLGLKKTQFESSARPKVGAYLDLVTALRQVDASLINP